MRIKMLMLILEYFDERLLMFHANYKLGDMMQRKRHIFINNLIKIDKTMTQFLSF